MKRFFDQTDLDGLEWDFTLVDSCYPLPCPENNRFVFQNIAELFKVKLIRLDKNHGQSGNFNVLVAEFEKRGWAADDVLAFWEPDAFVLQKHWAKASASVLADETYRKIGFVTPHRKPEWVLNNQGKERVMGGERVKEICWPGGFPMGIYSWGFVQDMKQLNQCRSYYGGTELDIVSTLNRCNRVGMMFCDIEDIGTNQSFDQAYVAWKQETIVLPSDEQLDFQAWLIKRGLLSPLP